MNYLRNFDIDLKMYREQIITQFEKFETFTTNDNQNENIVDENEYTNENIDIDEIDVRKNDIVKKQNANQNDNVQNDEI